MEATTKFTLEDDQVSSIRRALLIGLASYGEIERLSDAVQIEKTCGREVLDDLHPIHPTGAANTINEFADALRTLDNLEAING